MEITGIADDDGDCDDEENGEIDINTATNDDDDGIVMTMISMMIIMMITEAVFIAFSK